MKPYKCHWKIVSWRSRPALAMPSSTTINVLLLSTIIVSIVILLYFCTSLVLFIDVTGYRKFSHLFEPAEVVLLRHGITSKEISTRGDQWHHWCKRISKTNKAIATKGSMMRMHIDRPTPKFDSVSFSWHS